MAKTPNKSEKSSSPESSLENLEKVRELLFGSQLGAVESKISSTEEQLGLELKNLGTQTRAGLDSLEKFTRDELDDLAQRIAEERTRREDQGDDLQAELERTAKEFERKLGALEDRLEQTSKTLRQQSHDAVKELREQTLQQINAVQEHIKTTDARLSDERVHRDTLAGLFRDIAAQLDREPVADMNEIVNTSQAADAE